MTEPGDPGLVGWGRPDPEAGPTSWPQPVRWPPSTTGPRPRALVPPPYAAHPHAVPQPYYHLLRTPRWRWWRPLAGLPLLAVLWLLANVVLIAVAELGTWVTSTELELFTGVGPSDAGPLVLLTGNLALALLIPAAWLAVLVVHRERPGWLSSVTGRLRWALLWRFTLVGAVTTVTAYGGLLIVSATTDEPTSSVPIPDATVVAVLLAVTVLSTPLQAAAEEYAFRGYLLQAIAGWIPRPRLAVVFAGKLSAVLFAAAHGTQDSGLFAARFFFGVVAVWTVFRTGGLEAAIALHAVNNLVVLVVAISTGTLSDALTVTELPWRYAAIDMVATAAFGALVVLWCRRVRPERVSAVITPYAALHEPAARGSAVSFGPRGQIG